MSIPLVKPPTPLFLFFLSVPPFLLFDRAAGFLSPRPRIVAGRRAQGVSRLSAFQRPPGRARPLHDRARRQDLMGRVDYTPYLMGWCYCIPITDVFFGRSCYEVHGACDSRINLYPAAPIRLAKVLLAWTIAQVDGAHLLNGILASANLRCGSTATHPTCPTHGCRNSARYRVRVAPCGTRPCSR